MRQFHVISLNTSCEESHKAEELRDGSALIRWNSSRPQEKNYSHAGLLSAAKVRGYFRHLVVADRQSIDFGCSVVTSDLQAEQCQRNCGFPGGNCSDGAKLYPRLTVTGDAP